MTTVEAGINSPWTQTGINASAGLGATRARIGWESTWSLTELQSTIDKIHAAGLKVTVSVSPASRIYSEQGFVAFCVKVARMLVKPGDVMEVHNEPNHNPFAATPNAIAYAKEFVDVWQAVKAANPTLTVILGGMSPETSTRDPRQFLVEMINKGPKVGGVSGVLLADGAAMHPYCFPSDPTAPDDWNPVRYLDQLSNIFLFCGRPNMPFHLTEFGAPSGRTDLGDNTGKPDPQFPTLPYRYDEKNQAEWLVKYLEAFRKSKANIVSAQWYCLDDGNSGAGSAWDPYTGLRHANGSPKPVAQIFRAWAASVGKP